MSIADGKPPGASSRSARPRAVITPGQPHEPMRRKVAYIRNPDMVAGPMVVDAEGHESQHGYVKVDVPTRVYPTPGVL